MTNMLSRKTILLSLTPSLSLLLLVAFTYRLWLADIEPFFAAAYVVGMPLGIWVARRYGRLTAPYRPLI